MLIITATFLRQLLLEVFEPGVGLLEGVPGDGGVRPLGTAHRWPASP